MNNKKKEGAESPLESLQQRCAAGSDETRAEADETKREALFDGLVSEMYAKGAALEVASVLETDTVIDPVETRRSIISAISRH